MVKNFIVGILIMPVCLQAGRIHYNLRQIAKQIILSIILTVTCIAIAEPVYSDNILAIKVTNYHNELRPVSYADSKGRGGSRNLPARYYHDIDIQKIFSGPIENVSLRHLQGLAGMMTGNLHHLAHSLTAEQQAHNRMVQLLPTLMFYAGQEVEDSDMRIASILVLSRGASQDYA